LALVVLAVAPASAHAQPSQPAAPPAPAPAPPTPEQKQQATTEFQAGQQAEKQTPPKLDEALDHYQKAFAIYPDPVLQLVIGEVHRRKGEDALKSEDFDAAIADFQAAVTAYNQYIVLAPTGKEVDAAKQRIDALNQGIENAKQARDQKAAEAKKQAQDQAATQQKAVAQKQEEESEESGSQLALDGDLIIGVDKDTTALARLMAGGLLGWGRFAFEGSPSSAIFRC
jgi:tetratricopeptide (TPR) repeat protein